MSYTKKAHLQTKYNDKLKTILLSKRRKNKHQSAFCDVEPIFEDAVPNYEDWVLLDAPSYVPPQAWYAKAYYNMMSWFKRPSRF